MRVVERLSDGRFSFDAASGRLIDEFALTGIHVRTPAAEVRAASAALAWRPARLLAGELAVTDLTLRGIDVELKEAPAEEDSGAGVPRLPISIVVDAAAVERLAVSTGGQRVVIDNIALGFSWIDDLIAITNFSIDAGPHHAEADASATTRPAGPVSAELDYQGEIAGHETAASVGAGGTGRLIDLSLTLSSAADARLSGTIDLGGGRPRLSLTGSHDTLAAALTGLPLDIAAGSFNADATPAAITVDYAAQFDAAPAARTLNVKVDATLPASASDALLAKLDWSLTPIVADRPIAGTAEISWQASVLNATHRSVAPYQSATTLTLDLRPDDPLLDARTALTDFGPLPAGAQTIAVPVATLTARGPLSRLAVALDATLAGAPWEQAGINGSAVVTDTGVDISALTVAALGGSARAEGRVGWQPRLNGALTVRADGLEPAPLGLPEQTVLGFDANVTLSGGDTGTRVDIAATTLRGRWRDYPVSGNLNVASAPGQIRISDSTLGVGANRIIA
ncbi:MAG: hypothetical protein KJO38_10025, partial [Gammaproteobacteria bacterium]|nr:hypothetical protein [Gammaproteobacteria bacterium]